MHRRITAVLEATSTPANPPLAELADAKAPLFYAMLSSIFSDTNFLLNAKFSHKKVQKLAISFEVNCLEKTHIQKKKKQKAKQIFRRQWPEEITNSLNLASKKSSSQPRPKTVENR